MYRKHCELPKSSSGTSGGETPPSRSSCCCYVHVGIIAELILLEYCKQGIFGPVVFRILMSRTSLERVLTCLEGATGEGKGIRGRENETCVATEQKTGASAVGCVQSKVAWILSALLRQ